MTSPFLCLCDSPENYRGQAGLDFLRGLPTVWDETRVLDADFAKHVVIARRSGRNWWLAAMNDTEPLTLNVPLSFLGGDRYKLETFSDGAKPTDVDAKSQSVDRKGNLTINMAANGGFVARLTAEH
jgi:alpha-glucosidase